MKRNCSIPNCGKLSDVKRIIRGVDGLCPNLVVYLCSDHKEVLLWSEDVIKEEKLEGNDNVV